MHCGPVSMMEAHMFFTETERSRAIHFRIVDRTALQNEEHPI